MAKQWKTYKKMNVSLVNNEKGFLKCTSRPTHIWYAPICSNYPNL